MLFNSVNFEAMNGDDVKFKINVDIGSVGKIDFVAETSSEMKTYKDQN